MNRFVEQLQGEQLQTIAAGIHEALPENFEIFPNNWPHASILSLRTIGYALRKAQGDTTSAKQVETEIYEDLPGSARDHIRVERTGIHKIGGVFAIVLDSPTIYDECTVAFGLLKDRIGPAVQGIDPPREPHIPLGTFRNLDLKTADGIIGQATEIGEGLLQKNGVDTRLTFGPVSRLIPSKVIRNMRRMKKLGRTGFNGY